MSVRTDLALLQASTRLALPTERLTALTVATGPRGLERTSADVPLLTPEAFVLYSQLGQVTADVTAAGQIVARGRVEDIEIGDQGASITALGPWRELSDPPYTALWSTSGVPGWFPLSPAYNATTLAVRTPEMYVIELSERIQASLTKGASYGNGIDTASVGFRNVSGGARDIVGIQFSATFLLPADWRVDLRAYSGQDFSGAAAPVILFTSAGVLASRAYHIALSGWEALELIFFNLTGGASAPAGETGDWYVIYDDIRVVTSTANRVNTTLTANRAAGVGVTATVGSTAGMYAGMQLVMNSSGNPSEVVTVTSVTNATQFVADFVGNYVIGNAVEGFRVTADEVVSDVLSFTKSVNSGGVLSSSTALIEACDRDLLNATWEDTTPADIIGELAERGDGTQRYEAGAMADGLLYFRPAGSDALAWYVDASDLQITQTLDGLVNSVYPRYQAADGRTLRASPSVDDVSVSQYGLTRRGAVDADTTNATIAGQVAATALAETADPVPRASLAVRGVYTETGAPVPLWLVRAGDTVTIRNLPPAVGASVNRIQTFRLAATEWDAVAGTLKLTPESPQPAYESQVAASIQAAEVAASSSGTPAATPITLLPPQQARRRNPPGKRIGPVLS